MAAPCATAKTWKQPKWIGTDEWVNKMGYLHTARYYSAIKASSLSHLHGMSKNKEGSRDDHTKWREAKTNIIWYHLVLNYNNGYKWTSLTNRNASQHSKAPYSYQKGNVLGSEKWAGGDEHTHTTLYEIISKDPSLLCTQQHTINYMGREPKKGHVHVYA